MYLNEMISRRVKNPLYLILIFNLYMFMKKIKRKIKSRFYFDFLIGLVNTFNTEQKCIDYLEMLRWKGNVVSPYDRYSKVYKCKNNLYKCKNSNKFFNVKTGTLFENTKIDLQKWFVAIFLITSRPKRNSRTSIS